MERQAISENLTRIQIQLSLGLYLHHLITPMATGISCMPGAYLVVSRSPQYNRLFIRSGFFQADMGGLFAF